MKLPLRTSANKSERHFDIRRLLPSMITMLSLSSGMTGIRFALLGKFEAAVIALLIAAILDVMDGRVAILFKATSKFGAELDSLSDLVCFGVAPALILYIWCLQTGGSLGWLAALLFVICSALRLARFNTMQEEPEPDTIKAPKKYFTGVPTPSAAGLALLPLIMTLEFESDIIREQPRVVALWLIFVGLMMVSQVPTMALKGWKIPVRFVLPVMILIAFIAANLVTDTWLTLSVIGLVDLASLPLFYLYWKRYINKSA